MIFSCEILDTDERRLADAASYSNSPDARQPPRRRARGPGVCDVGAEEDFMPSFTPPRCCRATPLRPPRRRLKTRAVWSSDSTAAACSLSRS